MTEHQTKDGRTFFIRRPDENDAEKIIQYSKVLFTSTDQVLTTIDEYGITIEEEKTWINNSLQNPSAITLVAEMNKEIVGLLFFGPLGKKKNCHTGEFGVNVHPDYQARGIGRALIKTLLNWAKENGRIEKVFLNVFATNTNAIELYKNLGFVEEGKHVKAIKQISGEYVDIIQMYVETR
ncbi:MAG: GNAT family N-acetyltransferase [Bacteroidetes bacterium]|nr:GNAT family N-acetyltransferase [Bacteroidota bacterium]